MNGIIIYQGKYGATRQYAHWLGETLQMPVSKVENVTPAVLALYDTIIIGSSVYIGRLLLRDWLKENDIRLKDKKLFIFIVCSFAVNDMTQQLEIIKNNLGAKIKDVAEIFFLPGRCVVSGLSWKDRLMLKLGAWIEKDPEKKSVMRNGFDHLERSNLKPLIENIHRMADDY